MKIGVKIWPDKVDYALKIAGHADFIEVMAKRGCDFSFLSEIDLPFVVHAEHGDLGINYADSAKLALSRESLGFAIQLADRLEARAIIVHHGYLDGTPNTKAENTLRFLKEVRDNRILIENILVKEKFNGIEAEHPFSTPEKMKFLMEQTGRGFCLDLSHAQASSAALGLDYMSMLEQFMRLKPRHFHACGGVEGEPKDMHLHLWEGNLNIGAFRRMLPKAAWVTLETPCDLEGQIRDIEIMRG
ncbi:MAG: TIM barrel protein [Candidatus Aenigmarchaeota archaeon]|nr:TIM barrel protein [Candidatus Aenigmarchaeota archaeon]